MRSYRELNDLSDADLVVEYDKQALHVDLGPSFIAEEINRRATNRQTEAMLGYTRAIVWMTIVVTVATLINLVLTLALLFRH